MNPQVGAASTSLRQLLTGPERVGAVRHVGRRRAAVEVAGRLVVLVARSGPETLPCSVVVPGLDVGRLGPPGAAVSIGRRVICCAGAEVGVVRWWAPATVPVGARCVLEPGTSRDDPVAALGPVLDAETSRTLQLAATELARSDARAVSGRLVAVLGRGRGSTPDADDAVAGLLLAARAQLPAASAATVADVAQTVAAAAPGRTTLLSAELLRAAAEGSACPAVVRHLTAPTAETFASVLALGASSGAATLAGIAALGAALGAGRSAARPQVAA